MGSSKSVCLVTLAYGSAPQITQLPVPQSQPMRLLKGSLAEIGAAMEALRPLATDKPVWLDIEIDSDGWLSESERTLQQQAERQRALTMQAGETLSELTPDDVFSRRLALEQESDPQQQARAQRLFQQVLQEITQDPDTEETQA